MVYPHPNIPNNNACSGVPPSNYSQSFQNDMFAQLQSQINILKAQLMNQASNNSAYTPSLHSVNVQPRFIKEVQNEICQFNPDENEVTAEHFIQTVESAKTFYGLDDRNTIIHAKLKLKGPAKLWSNTEILPHSWTEFKTKFLENFGTNLNSADVHRRLRDRRQQPNETVRNYVYSMKLIASGYVDEAGLLTYTVEGLHNTTLARQFYTNFYNGLSSKSRQLY